jgi:hypothetical protein
MTTIARTADARPAAPVWMTWAPRLALGWAVAYGGLRVWFATGHEPEWKLPSDLLISNWASVAACLISVAAIVSVESWPRSRPAIVATWATAAGWVAVCAFALLDLVGGILPGLGIPFDLAGMLSRVGGLTRLAAQAVVGLNAVPYEGGLSVLLFEGGFLLAGVVLPLLLVHRLGKVFPRWMLLLPGAGLGAGITAYFGVGLIQMIVATLPAEPVYGDTTQPDGFFWVAIPAYLCWGVGLAVATYGYYLRTRKPCKACGR